MADIKIRGSAEVPWRPVDRNINEEMWRKGLAQDKLLEDENLARLAAMSTIFEGNALPYGVTKGQDVAARALSPQLKASLEIPESQKGRISMEGKPALLAKSAIIAEKIRKLEENGKEATPRAVMTEFNGEDQAKMIEKTGKDYVGWLSQILIDIALDPKNEKARKMMGSLLMPNSRDRR